MPSGQLLSFPIPGNPASGNAFPGTVAVSPGGRYIAILNDGWGTPQSRFSQSTSVLDDRTRHIEDFPRGECAMQIPATSAKSLDRGCERCERACLFGR